MKKFMKSMYVLWPDYEYIDEAIDAGIDTLIVAMYNPRPNMTQKEYFGTYQDNLKLINDYKGKVKIYVIVAMWQPWYPLEMGDSFLDSNGMRHDKTPCPTNFEHIDWVLEYPIKLYNEHKIEGIFIDWEDYGDEPNRLWYFRDWEDEKFKCYCDQCADSSEKTQRESLFGYIKYKLNSVTNTGGYPDSDPKMWKGYPNNSYWVNAYTYEKWGVWSRIWKHTARNKWFYKVGIKNIICGQWLEKMSAKESLEHLRKIGRCASTDGYWLYSQMRMSKNCPWRIDPSDKWSKSGVKDLNFTTFIDKEDPNYFEKLKKLNKKIDKYRRGLWFKTRRKFAETFMR